MNDREREREMSHLAIGGLKLTANQFRCEKLAKFRAEERGRGQVSRGEGEEMDREEKTKEEQRRKKKQWQEQGSE